MTLFKWEERSKGFNHSTKSACRSVKVHLMRYNLMLDTFIDCIRKFEISLNLKRITYTCRKYMTGDWASWQWWPLIQGGRLFGHCWCQVWRFSPIFSCPSSSIPTYGTEWVSESLLIYHSERSTRKCASGQITSNFLVYGSFWWIWK